ncbi:MAG: carbamoyltransferase HypF [Desulfobulbaceae bacterium]|nr:carbamoyltransferase HypF [Desulfobulbaceae bacterium]
MKQHTRQRIEVNGIVQGVGFRPFIHRLATTLGLTGFVANNSGGVKIEVQGDAMALATFIDLLAKQAPTNALITELALSNIPTTNESGFFIILSDASGPVTTLIAPDLCTCDACLQELFDPQNRRYHYPFINCTFCGPRFTIIRDIPYDRPNTSMAAFPMCPLCQAEYDDQSDRRFHAQPNACPVCGPQIMLCQQDTTPVTKDVFSVAALLLEGGKILAIKGLGGFHLAVDAGNDEAVHRLRQRKGRAEKPFAIMIPDLVTARELCLLTPAAEIFLASPQRPILLAPKNSPNRISPAVAPGVDDFGLMLPYTPLHSLLFHSFGRPLVMTSANLSEEPLCIDNQEAISRLANIADAFLLHNRDIVCRADDSVATMHQGKPRLLRRSRGQSPTPIMLEENGPQILAIGAELKNAICLLKERNAFLSQHLGDLKNLSAFSFFKETIQHFLTIFQAEPELVAHDLHPEYLSTRWAVNESNLPTLAVQHHHAHLAACLAENQQHGPAIGIILDGTGLGTDGTIWGGEILIGDFTTCERFAFLEPMPLPGGEAAIHEPWRTAVGYLAEVYIDEMPALEFLTPHDWQPVAEISKRGIRSPKTSSCGRLFDAVAAMAGGQQTIAYEGQAAIEFMYAAGELTDYGYEVELQDTAKGKVMIITQLLKQIVTDIQAGASLKTISQRFHRALVTLLTLAAREAARHSGIKVVALSGGVFANHLLASSLYETLSAEGFTVLSHSLLPPGDGCIALGQAMIGRSYVQGDL